MYRIGIDAGSTTIKLVVLDKKNEIIYSDYRRHLSNIKETLIDILEECLKEVGDIKFNIVMTGSGGLSLSEKLKVDFLQEVIAVTKAISEINNEIDVAIEIGGEDAKIIYFDETIEQRMNDICAGGTGSFMDQMASLLQKDTMELNELAKNYNVIYPIASRCGVFAKTDIQPLINENASQNDIAASIFQAVVAQTISGLACGKAIKGKVAFLGGPFFFLSELKKAFIRTLELKENEVIHLDNSHLFAGIGSALEAKGKELTMSKFIDEVFNMKEKGSERTTLRPLFINEDESNEFKERSNKYILDNYPIEKYFGDAYLGIDAGSTTTKIVLLGENNELLYTFYKSNAGTPLEMIRNAVIEIYEAIHTGIRIVNSCVTGYGEALIKSALKIDDNEIETVAHFKASHYFNENVDYILDIGGQDMKFISIEDGMISDILLNEACSSGCGSFIQSFANSLNMQVGEFANIALTSKNPTDLGSRCTVFMNSRVKQAQKEGATVADISAGLSYSVIKNALQKVIRLSESDLKNKIILTQGGTFYNDAVLRCFELVSGCYAIRPNIAGVMGAFGAALIAKERHNNKPSTMLTKEELETLKVKSTHLNCKLCSNNCLMTINKFQNGEKFITGNRCERGVGLEKKQNDIPNLYKYKEERVFAYNSLKEEKATRGVLGIPRVLNIYDNYPLWHTFFTELGYRVVLSQKSSRKTYEKGIESIPSASVCYPAKIAHGHVLDLLERKVEHIFYPSIVYENKDGFSDNSYNCPIVISYPENIKNNVDNLDKVNFINPFLSLESKEVLYKGLIQSLKNIDKKEIKKALDKGWEELRNYKNDVKKKGEEALHYIKEHNNVGIILAGHPYHIDSEINHGIPELISSYGFTVLSEDSISHLAKEEKLGVLNQWVYHSRMYASAMVAKEYDNIELVQLNSFGCGLDAITTDEVKDILKSGGKSYTALKIDEISNLGAVKIRIRSLIASINERKLSGKKLEVIDRLERVEFTKSMAETHTIICPSISSFHMDIIQSALKSDNINVVTLTGIDKEAIQTGTKYVNNDSCYPAIIVVGELINAIQSGEYDINNVSVVMTQTGGGCRASNYISLIRKAFKVAGLEHIPVISLNTVGIEKNEGFKLNSNIVFKIIQGIILGDLFMKCVLATRPYEVSKGETNTTYKILKEKIMVDMEKGKYSDFVKNIYEIVETFDNIPVFEIEKVKVGIVGEIAVKFNSLANNNIVEMLEKEGCEVILPDLLDFIMYTQYNNDFNKKYLGLDRKKYLMSKAVIKFITLYRRHQNKALLESKRFTPPIHISEIANMTEEFISLGNQTGEGWLLTGEMLELIHSGVNNVVCLQPFGCLPNHITGKGVVKKIKEKYKEANIVAIDYDPGASEVNQLNRLKLMLFVAKNNLESKYYKKNNSIEDKVKSRVKKISDRIPKEQAVTMAKDIGNKIPKDDYCNIKN